MKMTAVMMMNVPGTIFNPHQRGAAFLRRAPLARREEGPEVVGQLALLELRHGLGRSALARTRGPKDHVAVMYSTIFFESQITRAPCRATGMLPFGLSFKNHAGFAFGSIKVAV